MTTNSTAAEERLAKLGIHLPDAPTPFGAYMPAVQTGKSVPILIVPFAALEPVLPPQAKATSVAAVRTISPRARTIWFPLVLLGRP